MINIASFLSVLVLAHVLAGPPREIFFQGVAARSENSRRYHLSARWASASADLVLLGNSLLDEGVDENLLAELTGRRTLKLTHGGAASAWWYLVFKNIIATAPQKPRTVVLFFRDINLTNATRHTTGPWRAILEDMANPREPDLDRLVYLGQRSPLIRSLVRHSSLYQQRERAHAWLDRGIKRRLIAPLLRLPPNGPARAIERVFADERMDGDLLTLRQIAAANERSARAFRFAPRCRESFLPLIIDLAAREKIELICVRMKRRRDLDPGAESTRLKTYVADLRAFLESRGVPLIDFTPRTEIGPEYYGVGDHFNRETGRPHFTHLLAAALPYSPSH